MPHRPQITRVALQNFRSFVECDVSLGPLTFLVGRNGSGKSNFLHALRFVSESLRHSIDRALESHHGIYGVLRRAPIAPEHFGIRLDCRATDSTVQFAFVVRLVEGYECEVSREECRVILDGSTREEHRYSIRDGAVSASFPNPPPVARNRLYLVAASGIDTFRPAYDALTRMGFYNLRPEAIADFQPPDPGVMLKSDGGNIAQVIGRMERHVPSLKKRIEEYLASAVPGLVRVGRNALGSHEILEFWQQIHGFDQPVAFSAGSMSDGTLRALGVLVALFQCADSAGPYVVGIEEPEGGLHPAASEVLVDSFREASLNAQVIVTSNNADLLDDRDIPAESILAVVADKGASRIGPLDEPSRTSLREHLFTVGELMRMDQLRVASAVAEQRLYQSDLFEGMS